MDFEKRVAFLEDDQKVAVVQRAELKRAIDLNTALTASINLKIGAVVEFFDAMTGLFKVINWIGKAAKPVMWIVGLATAVIGLIAALKTGGITPK